MEKNGIVSEDVVQKKFGGKYTEFSTINNTKQETVNVFLGGTENDNANANAKKTFILTVEKCKFGKVTYGYLFRFETEFHDKDLDLITTSKETREYVFKDKNTSNLSVSKPMRGHSEKEIINNGSEKNKLEIVKPIPKKYISISNVHEEINQGSNISNKNNNQKILNKAFVPKM